MRTFERFGLAVLLFALCGDGLAQGNCDGATTTAAMENCQVARYAQAQKDLQAVYGQLSKQLDVPGRAKLGASEKAWMLYRDTNAAFHADTARGGTMAPLLKLGTQTAMTEERAAELKKLLH
jgi:uncharacterized protein YecT (DUF1311 family)